MKTLLQFILLSIISFSAFAASSLGESMAVDSENCAIIAQEARFEQKVGNYETSTTNSVESTGVQGR